MAFLARSFRRFLAKRRLRRDVAVYYHPEYAVEPLARTSRASLVDTQRAERILGALVKAGALRRGDVRACESASFQDLLRAHSASWLEASMRPDVLAHVFGLEPSEVRVDELLSAQRRAVGGTVEAARTVIHDDPWVAFNLGGGFHHAGPEQGAGFCAYNDVAVAIKTLRAEGFLRPIAVVDLDYHQGDGTLLSFAEDPRVLTWSIHGAVWCRVEAVSDKGYLLPPGTGDAEYLSLLREKLMPALAAHRTELVFYVAGTDVLAGDRLGGFGLSLSGALARDKMVARACKKLGVPMVVTLAGGYSEQAWQASASFLSWLLTNVPMRASDIAGGEGLLAHYESIAGSLDVAALQEEGDDLGLTMEDVIGDLSSQRRQTRFLGFYSVQGIELALERYGLLDAVRGMGFEDLSLEVDPSDPSRQILRLGARPTGTEEQVLLVEVVLRIREVSVPCRRPRGLEMLSMEWLLLQNPTESFSLARPKLPGQAHPGLGRSREVLALLVQVCKRLGLHGVVNRPGYFHVASVTAFGMKFLDPAAQGRFMAIREVLADWDLAEATVAVDRGRLRLRSGERVGWTPADFVLPVSERLSAWLESDAYQEAAMAHRDRLIEAGLHVEPEGG